MANWTYTIGDGYYYNHMTLTGNASNVKTYLESRGFSQYAIIGIIANMEHESYLNPGQQEHGYNGNTSYGYGLVQWTPARNKILSYASERSASWYDGDIQMDYLMINAPASWIPTTNYPYTWNEYKQLTDYTEAARTFFYNFERGTWHNDIDNYVIFWSDYLYGDIPPLPPTPPTPPSPPFPPSPDPSDVDDLLWIAIFLSKMLR